MPTFFASFTQHQQVAEIVVSSCAQTQNDGESLQYKANRSSARARSTRLAVGRGRNPRRLHSEYGRAMSDSG